ncbi:hypothetical protein D0C16_18645 [Cellvibrio sp. KY-GH-1]|nr:hypothetical protein D0C16_18645 [Cellvibrio sp. KY-GH-1]
MESSTYTAKVGLSSCKNPDCPLLQSGFFAFYVTIFVSFVAYFIKSATYLLLWRPKAVET